MWKANESERISTHTVLNTAGSDIFAFAVRTVKVTQLKKLFNKLGLVK